MRSTWVVARHTYLSAIARRGVLIALLLPVALDLLVRLVTMAMILAEVAAGGVLAVGERASQPPSAGRIGVVDQAGILAGAAPYALFVDEAAGQRALADSEIAALLIIPSDYLESGRALLYTRERQAGTLATRQALHALLLNALRVRAAPADAVLVARAGDPLDLTPVILEAPAAAPELNRAAARDRLMRSFVAAYILVAMMFAPASWLIYSLSEEKETRVIEVLVSSVTPGELLAGKVAGCCALGLTQIAGLLAVLVLDSRVRDFVMGVITLASPAVLGLVALYFLLGYLLYGTILAAGGALGSKPAESQQMLGALMLLAVVLPFTLLLFLSLFNPNNLNGALPRALSYFPLTAPPVMLLRLLLVQVPAVDLVASLAALALALPGVAWAGAKVFRIGLLNYGKRPTLRQLVRRLRESSQY